jgi:hypothetical protein
MRRSLIVLALLAASLQAQEESTAPRLSRTTIVENDRYYSADRRFCLVIHQIRNIPDRGGVRAGRLFRFSLTEATIPAGLSWVFTGPNRGHYASGAAFPARSAALYDGKRRIAKLELDFPWRGGELRISDSGRYLVLVPPEEINNELTPVVSIYRTDGSFRRSLFAEEVFSPGDLRQRRFRHRLVPVISEKDPSGGDVLLLTNPAASEPIRIDLATGVRLGEVRDVFPRRPSPAPSAPAQRTPFPH